jgi:surface carbohydrate biosynthesis protein
MKILLVLNKPNREIPIMESIKEQVLCLRPDAVVEIREMCTAGFNGFVFKFKPDVILTFPFTCEGFSAWYYLFKVFLGVKIISLRAEGVVDFSNEYNVQWAVGFDKYGKNLVDNELFWGEGLAQVVGRLLMRQGKLSSMERVKVVGYPRLETYFEENSKQSPAMPLRIKQQLANYEKARIVLFITGFHLANYTKQNLFDAKDLDAENKLDELLEAVEISRRFRSEWIANIIAAATENSDALIIAKKHPIEKREDYIAFEGVDNILFIHEDIQVDEIVPYAGIFFHYGSTALVDAYLSKTPAVYVYSKKNKHWYSDLGWPASMKIEEQETPQVVRKFLAGEISSATDDSRIKQVLKDIFNIEEGKPYKPSMEIAKIILDPVPPQKIQIYDPYFLRVIVSMIYARTFGRFVNLIRKIQAKFHGFMK